VVARTRRLDVLVNNAGYATRASADSSRVTSPALDADQSASGICERRSSSMDEPRGKNIEKMRRQGLSGFAPPIAQLLGMRAVAFDEGNAVLELEADGRHANPMGTLHGGVLCDLADLAMGVACYSTLEADESFTTLELKINFLKPIWTGRLTARAQVKKGGRATVLLECEIRDDKDSLVAFATSTCMVLRGDAAKGR
jgi:uncharacterized protein (TIGR00369 family)